MLWLFLVSFLPEETGRGEVTAFGRRIQHTSSRIRVFDFERSVLYVDSFSSVGWGETGSLGTSATIWHISAPNVR
jgi:hypothetical protein